MKRDLTLEKSGVAPDNSQVEFLFEPGPGSIIKKMVLEFDNPIYAATQFFTISLTDKSYSSNAVSVTSAGKIMRDKQYCSGSAGGYYFWSVARFEYEINNYVVNEDGKVYAQVIYNGSAADKVSVTLLYDKT